jgi:hypothetical protein
MLYILLKILNFILFSRARVHFNTSTGNILKGTVACKGYFAYPIRSLKIIENLNFLGFGTKFAEIDSN